jgi:hypothetical protein
MAMTTTMMMMTKSIHDGPWGYALLENIDMIHGYNSAGRYFMAIYGASLTKGFRTSW